MQTNYIIPFNLPFYFVISFYFQQEEIASIDSSLHVFSRRITLLFYQLRVNANTKYN